MTWLIPAKTFLIGEYIAMRGGPAVVLTTQPCFALHASKLPGLHGIHPASPAGRWFHAHAHPSVGLTWQDPYHGLGGLGASSAQFVGVYRAIHEATSKPYVLDDLLTDYFEVAWSGQGEKPSGYDVLAQSMYGCVLLEQHQIHPSPMPWCFEDLAFILLHTGKKLATHEHLSSMLLPDSLSTLTHIAKDAQDAFKSAHSVTLIHAINAYHQALLKMNLVAAHTQHTINQLKTHPQILAIKGCGAMGADIICIITKTQQFASLCLDLKNNHANIIATHQTLTSHAQI